MLNLLLHDIVYTLFEFYLFSAFWFLRLTTLDRLAEKLIINVANRMDVKVVIANQEKDNKNYEKNGILKKEREKKQMELIVYNRAFFAKAALYPLLGIADSFIDGWIDVDAETITGIIEQLIKNDLDYAIHRWHFLLRFWNWLLYCCVNNQTKEGVKRLMKVHYDFGNDVYEKLIGPTMQYSCGYWRIATNLDEAQIAKMDLIARKLKLQPGMRVLDIGCGWGSLANHLSTNYDVHVTAITPSKEGVKYIKEKFKDNKRLEPVVADYRDMQHLGSFDRIVSVGMFEHVGHKNYRQFFDICRERLKDDGILLLHTIASNQICPYYPRADRYIDKYVWPAGEIPYQTDIVNAINHRFVIEDWHNFGADYWKTCDAWSQNWKRNKDYVVEKYGIKTYRCFLFWLRCTVSFHFRRWHLWQIVLTKDGLVGGYDSVR